MLKTLDKHFKTDAYEQQMLVFMNFLSLLVECVIVNSV